MYIYGMANGVEVGVLLPNADSILERARALSQGGGGETCDHPLLFKGTAQCARSTSTTRWLLYPGKLPAP
jgi:hypothetical protein